MRDPAIVKLRLREEYKRLGGGWLKTLQRIAEQHPDRDVQELASLLLVLLAADDEE